MHSRAASTIFVILAYSVEMQVMMRKVEYFCVTDGTLYFCSCIRRRFIKYRSCAKFNAYAINLFYHGQN